MGFIRKTILFFSVLFFLSCSAFADQVQFLRQGQQSLAALHSTIGNAKKSIEMTYYIFEPCHASVQVLIPLLVAKAADKVKVRLVLDAHQYMKDKAQKQRLIEFFAQHNIQLRFFNDAGKFNPSRNFRSHIKLTVVDNETYISGGRNLGDEYFGIDKKMNFIDADVKVTGASARQATASFKELWEASMTDKPKRVANYRAVRQICKTTPRDTAGLDELLLINQGDMRQPPARNCENVRFITDKPDFMSGVYAENDRDNGPKEYMNSYRLQQKRTSKKFLEFLKSVDNKLEMMNYLYIVGHYRWKLKKIRDDGKSILIYTNHRTDLGGTIDDLIHDEVRRDNKGSQAILQLSGSFGKMSDRNELSPRSSKWMIHGKTAVADQRDVIVGSYNIDPRSFATNLESMVFVAGCGALVSDLEAQYDYLTEAYLQDRDCAKCKTGIDSGDINHVFQLLGYNFF